ncbi:receptor-like protein 12 [Cucurbita pepo subsp. pepo]|uniref:receptor-like protein 12 n=1 Tax=Cucurbita pepo subsp. pepo TaxID=3664 RepID=UPI000C9D9DD6|nr:receptor-like protein 12 [Cucurbita pepo subsp. pepo]
MRNLISSCIFLIFNSSILLSIGNLVVSGRCPEDQRSLLLEFRNNLTYKSNLSVKLVQWNESVDYCIWKGVTCVDGCVTGLDLSDELISGGIDNSSSLFSLRFLRILNLAFNRFNSTMPSGFERLSSLSVLNMSNSGFGGQIPIEISSLTGLVMLDLTSSSLFQASTLKLENPNLTTLVHNLSNLRVLYLDGVDLSAAGSEWCKALSSSLHNLRALSLSGCSLSGPLDSSLAKLPNLSEIRLDSNNFSSPVPKEFADFPNLTSLHLSNSRLFGEFPQRIFQVSTLQTLDLSLNMLLQGSLPDSQFNGSLQVLLLRNTNFSGELPNCIGYYKNLTRLDLTSCNFGGSIPNSIQKLTQLTYMDLSSNRFVGPIPSLSLLKNLTVLNLAHNRLNGSMLSTKWEELSNLVNLDLRNNSLAGNVPLSIFHLPAIQKIQLCNNQFNGSLNELSNVSSFLLDTLTLESNRLEGPFPSSFFELRGLKILSLSFNNFTGKLNLDMFKQLKNITRLELSSNSLSVETESTNSSSTFPQMTTLKLASCKLKKFPDFLKNQSLLNSLDLSDNELQGKVPLWIWGLRTVSQLNLSCNSLAAFEGSPNDLSSRLYLLDLHSNVFEGPLSVFPPSASYLDFSNNSFSSVIPPAVGNYLASTVFLSLSRNSFEGSIPESICNATSLQVLDLSSNNLRGMFPQCLTQRTDNLVVLNLRGNALNGSIPNTFPVTCSLRTLDLSVNNIEGKVPKSLSNCRQLEVLDLGNNQIQDVFPCPLKNISTLRVLVLRSNKFHGKFGCHEINGTWKSLQIVDISRNNFNGSISGKCIVKWKAMVNEEDYSKSRANHLRFNFFKFSSVNYQDTVTITSKGLDVELQKILTVYTSIDFSCNSFDGQIPIEVGQLRALYVLNLSHNSLSGEIPSSIGNLSQLGSLDLSSNRLSGTIPAQLAKLSFLGVLNLSYNLLVGMIPNGPQIQTFSPDSFAGNPGLCGAPLAKECKTTTHSTSDTRFSESSSAADADWQFIFIGVGFGVGAAAVVAPLMFLDVARKWSDETVDKIILVILPLMGYMYLTSSERKIEAEEDDDSEDEDYIAVVGYENEGSEERSAEFEGPYCVFCSKLDIYRKKVIHDPRCTCVPSPSPSSSHSTFL